MTGENMNVETKSTGHASGEAVADQASKSFESVLAAPAKALLDLGNQAVEGCISAQKDILDLMVQQSAQAVEATKEASGSA
jgi:hypothetical protein